MKIEQLFVQYLYKNKHVNLTGIGVFRLRPDIALPTEGDKDYSMPPDAFSFEYNLKTTEDEGLVDYIVEQTRKIKPLASSDLDSYAILAKQFLNIGKPFLIEGVGTIQKSQQGDYEFIPGNFITPKIDDFPKQLKERKEETVSFESESTSSHSSRNLIIGLTIVGVTFAGLAAYYFVVVKNQNNTEQTEPKTIVQKDTLVTDTSKTVVVTTDTLKKSNADSIDNFAAIPSPQIKTDNSSFKIVLKEYVTPTAAQNAYNRLTSYGHKLTMVKMDSAKYILVMSFKKPLSDTLRVKDSIKRFFGGQPYIQP